jgi:hypothetical protein
MTELAHAMVLDRSALARNVKPLERDGYLALRPDEDDGRSRRVDLTAAGRAKLVEANRLWRKAQRRFEEVYGEERAAALRVALAEIYSDEFAVAFGRPRGRSSMADRRRRREASFLTVVRQWCHFGLKTSGTSASSE